MAPKLNLFYTLKLGPPSKESDYFSQHWRDLDCGFVPHVKILNQRLVACARSGTVRRLRNARAELWPRVLICPMQSAVQSVAVVVVAERIFYMFCGRDFDGELRGET